MKPNLLIIPAWYPCSFFKEQADLVSEDFNVRILLGTMVRIGRKRAFYNYITRQKNIRTISHSNYESFSYLYVNKLPYRFNKRQVDDITQRIGDFILDLFDGEKPACIHIQSISDTSVFVCRWAKANHVRIVLTEHILFIRHTIDFLSRMREQVYREVDEVMCVSNYVYRNLLTSGLTPKKVSIIGNLVDDRFIHGDPIKKSGRVLFVANHYHDKNLDTLLSVAETIKAKRLSIEIDIIGLSEQSLFNSQQTMGQVLQQRNLEDVIHLLGVMSHNELLQTYSRYSVLLSTSTSETFGLAVAESIAYGTKVVCTDSGGIRDFVNETNGTVVPIQDVEAICQALIKTKAEPILNFLESEKILNKYGYKSFKDKIIASYNG